MAKTAFSGLRALLALTAVLSLGACAIPRPGVQGIDNASADMAIKSRMLRSEADFSGVDVTVVEGVALMTGHVPDQAAKDEAGRIAWSAPNIRDVGNELVVSPDGRRLLGANDQLIASQVRARLVTDSEVRSDRIHIEVYDAVVYLLGPTRSAAEADTAARLASVTPGVKRVVSFLSDAVPASDATSYDPFAGAAPSQVGMQPDAVEETQLAAPGG